MEVKTKLAKCSLEELEKRKKLLTTCIITFGILGVLLIVLLIVINANKTHFVPVLILPVTWLPMFTSLRAVNDELKLRTLKKQVSE